MLKALKNHISCNLIASGGVRDLSHIQICKELGLYGVITGKAIYEKDVRFERGVKHMLTKRIIPCLDVKDGNVVKGIHFLGLKEVGDPVSLAKKYYLGGADELVFLDISATVEKKKNYG